MQLHRMLEYFKHGLDRLFVRAHAHAQIFGPLNNFARPKVNARAGQRNIFHQQMILRNFHVLEHHLAAIHETTAEGFIATRDRKPLGLTRHQKTRSADFNQLLDPQP